MMSHSLAKPYVLFFYGDVWNWLICSILSCIIQKHFFCLLIVFILPDNFSCPISNKNDIIFSKFLSANWWNKIIIVTGLH